jgi:hypothetical protein
MTDHGCTQTITAVAQGRLHEAPPLTACTLDDLARALPALVAGGDSHGTLGRDGVSASYRAVRRDVAGQVLRVWHQRGRVLAIEVERPEPVGGWTLQRGKLGAPSRTFDVYRDSEKIDGGLWLYATRGLAAQTSLGGARLDRVMVFPPTSGEDFASRIARSMTPSHDHSLG